MTQRMTILGGMYLISALAFMTLNARGSWDFVLWFRGSKLLGITLVAVAISVATILFQTLTNNRILTPSLMGFDALYILVQTTLIFTLGGIGFVMLSAEIGFVISFLVMMIASLLLFGSMLGRSYRVAGGDLHRLLLTGIIFGVLFRSLSSFMLRIVNPNDFMIAATASIAQFSRVNSDLLAVSTLLILMALVATWRMRHELDILALGRDVSVSLGVSYKKRLYSTLVIISCLVSVSTALVGPVTFFGLLVANLTYQIMPTHRHIILLPAASLMAASVLIGGQIILEQLLDFSTPLSVIVEFIGGLTFLLLVWKGTAR